MSYKKVILYAIVCYFVAKYLIEPSPVGGIMASIMSPVAGMLSNLFGPQA